jgi:hypothetical protein
MCACRRRISKNRASAHSARAHPPSHSMKTSHLIPSVLLLSIYAAGSAPACDLCGCANLTHPWAPHAGIYGGAAEQYTRFETIQIDGHKISNDAGQRLSSSITQVFLGYHFNSRFGMQVNLPLIRRSYRRTAESGIDVGDESGFGDTSMLLNYTPIFRDTDRFTFIAKLTSGIKLPTGDSGRLREETAEGHAHADAAMHVEEPAHEHAEIGGHDEPAIHAEEHAHEESTPDFPANAVHGHDLALGSGSWDPLFGASIYARWQRVFVTADVQYAIRTRGDHQYHFANDLLWNAAPGVYLIDTDNTTLALQCVCSGETKGRDEIRGVEAEDTAITSVFLGPKITATWKNRFSAEVGLDLPVSIDNSSLQIVPDYRVRAAVSFQF